MPHRATGMAKRAAATRASGIRTSRAFAGEGDGSRAIALNLAPLVAPYRTSDRLSLRIERLPPSAILSAGRNNGDNSWSLAFHELDHLAYLPPETVEHAHSLVLRVIDLEGGSTVAVLDVPVSPALRSSEAGDDADERKFASLTGDLLMRRPEQRSWAGERPFLARKGEARPSALPPPPSADGSAALTELRTRCERAEASLLEAGAEANRLREESARLRTAIAERDHALMRAGAHIEQTRESWRQDLETALSKAREAWESEEAARRAASEAGWKAEFARALSEAQGETDAARNAISLESLRLSEENAALTTEIAERDAALAQAHSSLEHAREEWRRETEAALSQAASAWRSGEASRLAAAEARWESRLADAIAESEAAQSRDAAELHALQQEMAGLRATLAERDASLAQAALAIEQTRERGRRDAQDALAKAEAVWKAEASARVAAAEARGKEETEQALSRARSEAEAAQRQDHIELAGLREELARLQRTLAEGAAASSATRSAIEEARERAQQELEAALSTERAAWLAEQTARLEAAEAQWREDAANALAHARAEAEGRERAQGLELHRLREKLTLLQGALADRDIELACARSAAEAQSRELRTQEPRTVLHPDRIGAMRMADWPEKKARSHLLRDILVAGVLGAAAIILYPHIAAYTPQFATLAGRTPATAAPPVAPPAVTAPPPAFVSRGVNVRSGPSTGEAIVLTLPRGAKVTTLERRGNWTLIRWTGTPGATPQQGWVYSTFLESAPATSQKPQAPKAD